jgi:cell wall assembly regulator SMI1
MSLRNDQSAPNSSSVPTDIAEVWRRIEHVLAVEAPEVHQTLQAGATAAAIDIIEKEIGFRFPVDLRGSLQIHNGQHDPSRCLKFCGSETLMTTDDIIRDWQMLTEVGKECDLQSGIDPTNRVSLNDDWWKQSCIPFADSEGYYSCVDMDPALGTSIGQVVYHTHDSELEVSQIRGYGAWLKRVMLALEAGRFQRDEYGFFHVSVSENL